MTPLLHTRNEHPLTEFLRRRAGPLSRLKETGVPEVLTVDGRPELVLQDAQSYQALVNRLRDLEDLVAIREGIRQADAGLTRPADEFFPEFMRKVVAVRPGARRPLQPQDLDLPDRG